MHYFMWMHLQNYGNGLLSDVNQWNLLDVNREKKERTRMRGRKKNGN